MNNDKKIILIDGNSLMFRSYYATAYTGNLMKTSKGQYTNALFGFSNMLTKLLEENGEYVFVAFDAGKQTFRHQEYQDYKGTRAKLPDELREQIPLIKKYLDILKIKRMESLDFEADDLIATVATMQYNNFEEIKIITGDKDLLQLVNGKIKVCLTRKGVGELEEFNSQNFYEKMGFYPHQMTDYKGLVGDPSDNLPGIKGVGEKTAIKLLNEYQSIENIYQHIAELKGKTKELFENGKDAAYMCKHLATLKKDIAIDINRDELLVGQIEIDELISFFQEMEFTSLLKRINKQTMGKKQEINCSYQLINKVEQVEKLTFSLQTIVIPEIFGSNYYKGEFLGLGILTDDEAYFITKDVVTSSTRIKHFFEDSSYEKKTFDYKALLVVLARENINLEGVVFDLLLDSYLIDPSYGADDFKKVIDNFVNNNLPYYDNVYGANTKMVIPNIQVYSEYAINKALTLRDIYVNIRQKIKEIDALYLSEIELGLAKVLGKMELSGLKIDVSRLRKIGAGFQEQAEIISKQIYEFAGEEFNINSPKQLGEILFEKMKLPHGKKNKTGFSTNVDVLEKLASDYEIANLILKYRGYVKLVSTYVNGIIEVTDENEFIHPLYKQALTLTGRLSSIEPNIQNMPIRTEEGQVIREVFVSRFPDGVIISADYSQIELRVLSHMADDDKMIDAFKHTVDFHAQTASEIFDVKRELVTKEMRRAAKAINFGIIYGMSAWGLSEALNISPLEANIYINKYFYTFDQAKACLDRFVSEAKANGYSLTLFHRRRYLPEIKSENANVRGFGERTAMNSPIQGTAADIIKIAMVKVYQKMKEHHLNALLIAQVHDELVFDCPISEVEVLKTLIKEVMESAVTLKVPVVADVKAGENWFLAK
jgi:DNA polymerase-1